MKTLRKTPFSAISRRAETRIRPLIPALTKPRWRRDMAEKPLCSIPDCEKPSRARGWCTTHWWRWRHNGSPTALAEKPKKLDYCSVENCNNPPNGKRGMCNAHYIRWYRHGDAEAGRIANGATLLWIEQHANYAGDDCIIWPFARDNYGYGKGQGAFSMDAHREMCFRRNGPPPFAGARALHTCGHGHDGCVNPRHLRWGTAKDNADDRWAHGTMLYGSSHPTAVLTEDDVREIRTYSDSSHDAQLADRFGLTKKYISHIRNGHGWEWMNGPHN